MLGASATSLGRLCHMLITLTVKLCFLVFLFSCSMYSCDLCPLWLVLSAIFTLVFKNVVTFVSYIIFDIFRSLSHTHVLQSFLLSDPSIC